MSPKKVETAKKVVNVPNALLPAVIEVANEAVSVANEAAEEAAEVVAAEAEVVVAHEVVAAVVVAGSRLSPRGALENICH